MVPRQRRHRQRYKGSQRQILLVVIPLTFILALLISLTFVNIPNLIRRIVTNMQVDYLWRRGLIDGSAVRKESEIRKNYEMRYRDLKKGDWLNEYDQIMQNTPTEKKEIRDIENVLKDQKIDKPR